MAIPNSSDILQAVIGATPDAIFVKDLDGRYVLVNDAAARFVGRRPQDVVGKNDLELYPEETARRFMKDDQEVLASGQALSFEGVATSAAGTQAYLVTKGVYRDNAGNLLGIYGISHNITELRTAQDSLEHTRAALFRAQKMEAVGQLTGGIAHDFNNMLAVVVGGIDLARRRLSGPRRDVQMHLNNAMEGANRAAALTRRLLSFARSEPLLPEHVSSAELVEAMGDLLDRTLGERIQVETRLRDEAWPVFVDPHQLENAILNLAVNARDAMDGEGKMTIVTDNVTMAANAVGDIQPGDYLRISVRDIGTGMTDEVIDRAFEPFFTTKEVGKGTGLGLSQIFGFAHQSGGEVGIESALGQGTTVSLYLPRAAALPGNVRIHPAAQRIETEVTVEGARILLVEDDPRVRTATVGALEDLGYEPISCSSGEEAMRLFVTEDFDLVVSDVIMPEMTGPELVRELRQRRPDIAVLFVTGYVGDGESDDLAGHELLRKPFTVNALANAVAVALQRGGDASGSRPIGGAAAAG